MQRRRVAAAAGSGFRRPTLSRPPAVVVPPSPTTCRSTGAAPSASESDSVARTAPSAAKMGSMAGGPFSSSFGSRLPSSSLPQFFSPASARISSTTGVQGPALSPFSSSIGAYADESTFSDLLQSPDGFMSYMMGHQQNSPIDIEGEEAGEEDGDGVRTVVRLFWKPEEDERVMSAWLKHSIDSIKGNNKKAEQYWSDVAKEYNLTTPSNRHRTRKQVKEKWHKVNKWANMFNDCYMQIRSIYTSGYSKDMWLEKAHEMYVNESKGQHFVLMNVWNMVRNQAKWISYNSPVQNKNKRKVLEEDNDVDGGGLEDFDLPRPMGQKKAKKIASENKGKSKESAIDVDEIDRFEKIQNGVHANRVKLLEMQGKLNNDKMEVSKIAPQRAKEEKAAKVIE